MTVYFESCCLHNLGLDFLYIKHGLKFGCQYLNFLYLVVYSLESGANDIQMHGAMVVPPVGSNRSALDDLINRYLTAQEVPMLAVAPEKYIV